MVSTLIKNGVVYDPINNLFEEKRDIFLHEGRIAMVGSELNRDVLLGLTSLWCEFDATECIVCPGLIDLHVHCYPSKTSLGVDPDVHCLPRGVTTVIDAGSAGSDNFTDFKKYIATRKTRVLALLHVSKVGLTKAGCATDESSIGELEYIDNVNIDSCIELVKANPELIVGTKLRLSAQIAKGRENELEGLRRALKIREKVHLPLMVHHSFSTIPLKAADESQLGVPGSLFSGDIRTHMFHGFMTNIVDPITGRVDSSVHEARLRGVYADLGHGQGGFSWTVAEISAKEKMWPDAISTDLHTGNISGPAYDLPTVMTKLLHVGMPLASIIEAVTSKPATIVAQESRIGCLSVGACADVTVLRLDNWDELLEDTQGQTRRVRQKITPVAVWRNGEKIRISSKICPNQDPLYMIEVKKEWKHLVVRDESDN